MEQVPYNDDDFLSIVGQIRDLIFDLLDMEGNTAQTVRDEVEMILEDA